MNKLFLYSFSFLLLCSSWVSAHFTLEYPPTRGFSEDLEDKFCGGFQSVSARHPFPLSGPSPVSITSFHGTPQVSISLSFQASPVRKEDFNITPIVKAQLKATGPICFSIDISNVTHQQQQQQQPTNGSLATLLVQYENGDEKLYQCSDLILIQNATNAIPNNLTCPASSLPNANSSQSQAHQNAAQSDSNRLDGSFSYHVYSICLLMIISLLAYY